MRSGVFGILGLVLAACGGGGGGNCIPAVDLSGSWSGPVSGDTVARGNPGTVDATITQSSCTLGGNWTFSFTDTHLDKTLEIHGSSPQTSAVGLDLTECFDVNCQELDPCHYQVGGTLVSPTEINGTYTTLDNCSASRSGSFDITLRARLTPTPNETLTPFPTLALATATPTP